MKTAIYKAQVSTPFGEFTIAVDSTKPDARTDIRTAAMAEFNCHFGTLTIKNVVKSNRRILAKMTPIKKTLSNGKHWAWIQ